MTSKGKKISVADGRVAELLDWPLQSNDGVVKVVNTSDKFEVGLEVQYFTPKEISVKTGEDTLIVDACHNERSDAHGVISREIHRTYHVPNDVDMNSFKSKLNEKGVLVISASKKKNRRLF